MGLDITYRLLAETPNEAAVPLLLSALDASDVELRRRALIALAKRTYPRGPRELLRRLHKLDADSLAVLREHGIGLRKILADALGGLDTRRRDEAARAALTLQAYDLIGNLVAVLEGKPGAKLSLVSRAIVELSVGLSNELHEATSQSGNDVWSDQRKSVGALETALARYAQHQRREVIEAFLLLVRRDNQVLRRILESTKHPAHVDAVELLRISPRPAIVRLAASFFEDASLPQAAREVAAGRFDRPFLEQVAARLADEPTGPMASVLSRITSLPWLRAGLLEEKFIDDDLQPAVVRLVAATGLPRDQLLAFIHETLSHGGVAGRRTASQALATIQGNAADELTRQTLADQDGVVVAHGVSQLRSRSMHGALATLIEMLDNPDDIVREAARSNLHEFSFDRYLRAFDNLDDELRVKIGRLVRKIDTQSVPTVVRELKSGIRTRRLRALAIVTSMSVEDDVESELIDRLTDADHVVRAATARTMGGCTTWTAREALRDALTDSSYVVQEAAEASLARMSAATPVLS